MRLFLLIAFAVGTTLVQAPVVLASLPGYSIGCQVIDPPASLVSPDDTINFFGGPWTTGQNDTVGTVTFFYSSDGGVTYTPVNVPAADIQGQGGRMGSWTLQVTLKTGNYTAYVVMKTKNNVKVQSTSITFSAP